jgi:gliding motility-associated-like protein
MQKSIAATLLYSFLFLLALPCLAQQFWMQQGGGITIDEGADVSIDGAGNTYATGYFTGTCTFGTINVTSSGTTDIYLAKVSPTGLYLWVVKAGGAGSDRPFSIKTDAAGNSYLTGFFYGTATFGSLSVTANGLQDAFIAKYDNAGNCLWVKNAGGSLADIGNGITVDNSGNVIVTGEFSGTASFGSLSLTSMSNSVDVFTTKLDGSGNFLWAKKGSAPQTDRGIDVAANASGDIFVTGQFTDTITFDVTHYNQMYNAIFLIKYNSAGAEQWFRVIGGASQSISNAIVTDNNGNPILAGDFLGTLTFFAAPVNSTVSALYSNKIFVAKYDVSGNKIWSSASSSSSALTAHNLAVDASDNPFVIGNFKCKLNDYADQYGQGTFNSVGYWDIYVSKWNSSGSWLWARQVGGHKDDYGTGITLNSTGQVIFTGSFNQDLYIPTRNGFLGYDANQAYCNSTYCSDNFYGTFRYFNTIGNSDIIISKTLDSLRQPYDYYDRSGTGCNRPQLGVCIYLNAACPDTIEVCQSGYLSPETHTCPTVGPDYTYLWSTGSIATSILVNSSGIYSVTQTTEDGCFSTTDSVTVIVHPNPPAPTISDDVIINTNSTAPQTINLCLPDSVVLTGGNFGSNTYSWTGPGFPGVPTTTITVTVTGTYCFRVTDSFGCTKSTCIIVNFYPLLPPFDPKLICLSDPDMNDTVTLCMGDCFEMLVYDSITNPNASPSCFPSPVPYTVISSWTVTPTTGMVPYCNSLLDVCPSSTGWYNVDLMLVRVNICDTDTFYLSKPIYAIVNPIPSTNISITGNTLLCPGDSSMLTTSGACTNPMWSGPGITGLTTDTVWVMPGNYSVTCSVTNSFGCTAVANAFISVTVKPQPIVAIIPSTGLICPPDSLRLICTTAGTYQWQGPSGPIGGNTNSIYVSQAGNYYCIVTDADGCVLVSNTVLVIQYSTPFLIPPIATICPGDSLVITVVASPGAIVNWLPPLSGTGLSQTVWAPGDYYAEVNSCGITTSALTHVDLAAPVAQITAVDSIFCEGDSVTLTANTGMSFYLWSPGSVISQTYAVTQTGTYTLTTSDAFNCTATDVITLYSYPDSTVTPQTSDTVICAGQSVTLTATGISINWYSNQSPGSLIASGNTITVPALTQTTVYYVASSDSVCRSEYVPVNVIVNNCNDSIPNVFTPNNDGKNDFLLFSKRFHKCYEIKIYNRWGNLIYEGSDPLKGWHGENNAGNEVNDGTYYYILKYCEVDKSVHTLHGYIQLIRG